MEFEPRQVVGPDHGLPVIAAATSVARSVALRSIAGEELRALLNADGARLDMICVCRPGVSGAEEARSLRPR